MLRPRIRRAFRLAVRRRDLTEADVDEELRLHVELRAAQLVAAGWDPEDADAEARARFGPSWSDTVRHLHRSGHAREERLAMRERLDSLRYDLRHVMRGLRRAPRYTGAAVLTLALGLGATTVIFTLVDHVVLRPLPYAAPERLVVVREEVGALRSVYPSVPANASHFLEWRRTCTACEGLAAITRAFATLSGDGDPQRLGAARVSANLFPLLGIRPQIGRGFREEEDRTGGANVVVLSDALWQRQFAGSPAIVGTTIVLDGTTAEVIGVMPPAIGVPGGDALGALVGLPKDIDVYRPLALTEQQRRSSGSFDYAVIARLRANATLAQARAQLDAVMRQFEARNVGTLRAVLVPLQSQIVGPVRRPLLLLLGAVGAMLLIVCVNLVNLSLARAAGRQRESAVRVALGAGASRLVRLALIESVALAVIGAALGLVLARWGLRTLVSLAPATMPRVADIQLDGRVFTASLLLTVLVGLAVGALPALAAGRTDPAEALKAAGRSASGGRAATRRRALFIGAQAAFSTLLLVGTGLFLASFVRVLRVDAGVDREHVVALDVALPMSRFPSGDQRRPYYDRVLAEVAAVPGIEAAAVASALPLEGETWVDGIGRADGTRPPGEHPSANFRFVSPDYFAVVGTPLRGGRVFSAQDRGTRVAMISERTAATLWPGERAIGKRMHAGGDVVEVIGVAADARTSTLEDAGSLVVYMPIWDASPSQGVIVARTTSVANAAAIAAVRAALRRVDPSVPVPKMRTMGEVVSATLAARRFQLALLLLFAALALVTASVGIYGVVSQSLAGRTREIGVRMALGARPADVHRLVLREGMTPVVCGLLAGIAGSLAAGRVIASLLFEVKPGDPLTIAGVSALLGLVALVACAIPARRAARGQLASMLRAE